MLNAGHEPGEALREELKSLVAADWASRSSARRALCRRPAQMRNAKVMHRVIRAAWLGEELGDLSSLERAGTVEAIRKAV